MNGSKQKRSSRIKWWVAGIIVSVLLVVILVIPRLTRCPVNTPLENCIGSLRSIYVAKEQWALKNHAGSNDVPRVEDIIPYLSLPAGNEGKFPKCEAGGTYTLGRVGEDPTCSIPGHVLPP